MSKFDNVRVIKTVGKFTRMEQEMFCWGRVLFVHKISDIEIIEYNPATNIGDMPLTSVKEFHVNGCSTSAPSLDAAIITAICYNHGQSNAVGFICKGLGLEK